MYNEHQSSIPATLIAYNSDGLEVQRDTIPAGGLDYDRPGFATQWLFTAPGYKDATVHDVLNYESYNMELSPKYGWLGPVLLGAAGFWVINKFF